MTRRQIALRALKLDHLCDKVIFTPVAEEALCHCQSAAMPLRSEISSRDNLNTLAPTDERRRTGRYVAGGTALAVMLLGLHHVLLRGAYTIAGVCIPTIIMASYIIWVLYSARRDARRKALRYATAIQLTEIVSVPSGRCDDDSRKGPANDGDFGKESRSTRENPAFTDRDEA